MGLLNRNANKPMSIEEFHKLEGIKQKDLEPNDKGIYITEAQLDKIPHSIDTSKQKISREQIRDSLSKELKNADESTLEEYTEMALTLHLEGKSQLDSFIASLVEKTSILKVESIDTTAISTEKAQNPKNNFFIQQVATPTVTQQTNNPKVKNKDLNNEGPEIE